MRKTYIQWHSLGTRTACILASIVALAGCGSDANGGPQVTTAPVGVTNPTPTTRTLTTITAAGTISPAGLFSQTEGSYESFTGTLLPTSAAATTPTPDTGPPTDPSNAMAVIFYTGSYTLKSGESGAFNLSIQSGTAAELVAVPTEFLNYQAEPMSNLTGVATVSLQLNGSTGTGTIQLSNGDSGVITITGISPSGSQMRAARRR
ncbi:MAG: hypothetical protein M3Y56_05565 [Armatimonadota bacterium]|nr:hypothetical protein [Armatimonadota bacterium]